MTTVIVPTDFSATADNAAEYAVKMLTGNYDITLVLYHAYEKASEADFATGTLNELKESLSLKGIVKIETRVEHSSDFIDSLDRLARHLDAQLIVMGISSKSKLEQIVFGSNTLKMVEKNACPVLIVPPDAEYTERKNVALTSDFKDVQKTTPVTPIKNILKLFNPSLHIVNVDNHHYVALTEEILQQRTYLMESFQEFRPEFYFIRTFDLHDTIHQFIQDKNIDMLVTIPRNHSMFSNIFKTSNTKKLVYESSVPILAAHE
jgi:nucleotide-binding universal stress UspA family protein